MPATIGATSAVPVPTALPIELCQGVVMHQETSCGDVLLSFQDQVFLFMVGEIDVASGPRLLALTRDLLDSGASTIVLDLSTVSFLDCAGLGHVVLARSRLGEAGRSVTMPTPSVAVTRLLERTSLAHLISPSPAPEPLVRA